MIILNYKLKIKMIIMRISFKNHILNKIKKKTRSKISNKKWKQTKEVKADNENVLLEEEKSKNKNNTNNNNNNI